jgi:hypothetical protein
MSATALEAPPCVHTTLTFGIGGSAPPASGQRFRRRAWTRRLDLRRSHRRCSALLSAPLVV